MGRLSIKITAILFGSFFILACGSQNGDSPLSLNNFQDDIIGEWQLVAVDGAFVSEDDSALLAIVRDSFSDRGCTGAVLAASEGSFVSLVSDHQAGCFIDFGLDSNRAILVSHLELGVSFTVSGNELELIAGDGTLFVLKAVSSL